MPHLHLGFEHQGDTRLKNVAAMREQNDMVLVVFLLQLLVFFCCLLQLSAVFLGLFSGFIVFLGWFCSLSFVLRVFRLGFVLAVDSSLVLFACGASGDFINFDLAKGPSIPAWFCCSGDLGLTKVPFGNFLWGFLKIDP